MIYLCSVLLILASGTAYFLYIRRKKQNKPSCPVPELTEWDRICLSRHEAGHAVCSFYLPERERLVLVTIDPSSEAFGMIRTSARPHHNETRVSLSSTISTFLAGRIAEEMFAGTVTTSCVHDLAAVQNIAADMVVRFGMGKNLGLSVLKNTPDMLISEHYRDLICMDIQQIIREAEENARKILAEHQSCVAALSEKLLSEKTLTEAELAAFFAERREKLP